MRTMLNPVQGLWMRSGRASSYHACVAACFMHAFGWLQQHAAFLLGFGRGLSLPGHLSHLMAVEAPRGHTWSADGNHHQLEPKIWAVRRSISGYPLNTPNLFWERGNVAIWQNHQSPSRELQDDRAERPGSRPSVGHYGISMRDCGNTCNTHCQVPGCCGRHMPQFHHLSWLSPSPP